MNSGKPYSTFCFYFNFLFRYSWFIVIYLFQVYSIMVQNFIGYTAFKITIKFWLHSLFCTMHLYNFLILYISSVQFSRSAMSHTLWPCETQHARPLYPSPTPGVYSNSCPLSQWCHQPSHPLSSPSIPAPNPSQHQGLFQWITSLHEVAKVLEFQLHHQSFQWMPRTYL